MNKNTEKELRVQKCKNPKNYQIVFKSGAVVILENVCLIKTTTSLPETEKYEFYKKGNSGNDERISSIFNHENVDAIFRIT